MMAFLPKRANFILARLVNQIPVLYPSFSSSGASSSLYRAILEWRLSVRIFQSQIFWKSGLQIQMMRVRELNILCMGELMAGKSSFLEFYTGSEHGEQHYKIFAHRESGVDPSLMVYLHEIEDKLGVDVYLKFPFDALLFFVRIDDFHNTSKNVLEALNSFSSVSGNNVYRIPVRIVALSSKTQGNYNDISYGEKRKLREEVSSILTEDQIIYVESDHCYQSELAKFYREIIRGQAEGIKESIYSNWMVKEISNLFIFDQFKLHIFKLYGQVKSQCSQKIRFFSGYRKQKSP